MSAAAESLKLGLVFGGMIASMGVGVGTIMAISDAVDQRKRIESCAKFVQAVPGDALGFQLCMERAFPRQFSLENK